METAVANATEISIKKMTKNQKLAALLVMLGPDPSGGILNEFEEREVEEITGEIAKIGFVSLSLQKEILAEFSEIALGAVTSAAGGPEVARAILEKSLGNFRAHEVMSRAAAPRLRMADRAFLREIQPHQLASLLKHENLQAWALILSHLDPPRCARVLALLEPAMRTEIVERIATMEPVSSDVAQKVFDQLQSRFATRGSHEETLTGGTRILADILNILDDDTSHQVLGGLEERNPDLFRTVKKMLFRFEEILVIDKSGLAKIFREVDTHVLAVALKTANEELRAHVFAAMSKRAAENLAEEIRFLPLLRMREVEEAQETIIEVIRRLETSGELMVKQKKGENALV